jgi:hypothetical protein
MSAGHQKARALVDLARPAVEVGNVENQSPARKCLVREVQSERDKVEAEAAPS